MEVSGFGGVSVRTHAHTPKTRGFNTAIPGEPHNITLVDCMGGTKEIMKSCRINAAGYYSPLLFMPSWYGSLCPVLEVQPVPL
jgi:hypothetical protein